MYMIPFPIQDGLFPNGMITLPQIDNINYTPYLHQKEFTMECTVLNPQTLMMFFRGIRKMILFNMIHQVRLSMGFSLTFIPLTLKVYWDLNVRLKVVINMIIKLK